MISLRSKRFHRACAKGFPYVRLSFPLFGCAKAEASKHKSKRKRLLRRLSNDHPSGLIL